MHFRQHLHYHLRRLGNLIDFRMLKYFLWYQLLQLCHLQRQYPLFLLHQHHQDYQHRLGLHLFQHYLQYLYYLLHQLRQGYQHLQVYALYQLHL